jgi:NAD(P)-dependent dehydrogenase (short-subunit alcohol dehydrogenase family)
LIPEKTISYDLKTNQDTIVMPETNLENVALITGGGSGMGEAVGRHLAGKGWKVGVLDMNEKSGASVAKQIGGIFIKTDVANYDNQAAAFQQMWEAYGRLDFGTSFKQQESFKQLDQPKTYSVYANAGIVDTYPFYTHQEQLPPPKLPLLVQDVCLTGVVYSTYLGMHYMRRNPVKGGTIIMTSSGTILLLSQPYIIN